MAKLQVNNADGPHLVPDHPAHDVVTHLDSGASLEEEIMAMVTTLRELEDAMPDVIMSTCMAFMARCTEIYLQLVRAEGSYRKAKVFRVTQLSKVMELIEFEFKGASRLIEVRRQDVELSR